jgi:hypothetical protein
MEPDPAPPLKGARAAKPLIVLVGRNGQHKRALMWALADAFEGQLVVVPTITTRCPQIDDHEGEFIYRPHHMIDTVDKNTFIESSRRDDVDRTFYGRTIDLIAETLQNQIGIAVMSEEGALRVRAHGVVCYVIRLNTMGDPIPPPQTLSPAGLKLSEEVTCAPSLEGIQEAITKIRPLIELVTRGIQTTRPPGPPVPSVPPTSS